MFKKSHVDVLVVGAGPVGLYAALRFATLGRSVRVIDRGTHLNVASYGLALHPQTLALLDELALASPFVVQGRRINRVDYYLEGHLRQQVSLAALQEEDYPFALVLPQSQLEDGLRNALARHGVAIEWNRELKDLEQSGDRAVAVISHLKELAQGYGRSDFARVESGVSSISADLVVAADGAASPVRNLLRLPIKKTSAPSHFRVFEFEAPAPLEDALAVAFDGASTSIMWPMPNGRARWTFQTEVDHHSRARVQELQGFVATRAPWFRPYPTRMIWGASVSFPEWYAEKLGKGRVWIVGDAAHQALPFGVQSMNAGIAEANLLAQLATQTEPAKLEQRLREEYEAPVVGQWRQQLTEKAPEAAPRWLATHWRAACAALPVLKRNYASLSESLVRVPERSAAAAAQPAAQAQ